MTPSTIATFAPAAVSYASRTSCDDDIAQLGEIGPIEARPRSRAVGTGVAAALGAAALNKVLAQSGTYAQVITLLTRTHGASENGFTIWPGFLLAGTSGTLDAADAKALGVASGQSYSGITITIGASATENPYVPKIVSITHNVP